jgi:hypothetical protein
LLEADGVHGHWRHIEGSRGSRRRERRHPGPFVEQLAQVGQRAAQAAGSLLLAPVAPQQRLDPLACDSLTGAVRPMRTSLCLQVKEEFQAAPWPEIAPPLTDESVPFSGGPKNGWAFALIPSHRTT